MDDAGRKDKRKEKNEGVKEEGEGLDISLIHYRRTMKQRNTGEEEVKGGTAIEGCLDTEKIEMAK